MNFRSVGTEISMVRKPKKAKKKWISDETMQLIERDN